MAALFPLAGNAQVSQNRPYDYTNPNDVSQYLAIAERHHFNTDVQLLRRGQSNAFVVNDLRYVLDFYPNHHRVLDAMARLWSKYEDQNMVPPGARPNETPSYWYDEAIRYFPRDATVRLLYGIYLHNKGDRGRALELFDDATQLQPNSSEIHYNLGLVYLEAGEREKALQHATAAYELGYPLPGLRRKLEALGLWSAD